MQEDTAVGDIAYPTRPVNDAEQVIVEARAPLRISFAGGGTDLSPYAEDHGGAVLNATISRYAHAILLLALDGHHHVESVDLGCEGHWSLDEEVQLDGDLKLLKACLARIGALGQQETGLRLRVRTDVPPGSGLGSSSALVVAVVSALMCWHGRTLSRHALADVAWRIERKDVGIPGGLQDHYATAFGGFNVMQFAGGDDVTVTPLDVDPCVVRELQASLLLVYTRRVGGASRIIERQTAGYSSGKPSVVQALHRIKQLVGDAREALLKGQLDTLGEILHEEWTAKRATASDISTPFVDELYDAARQAGAIGGKLSGAGGGGYMFFLCPPRHRRAVTSRLRSLGAKALALTFVGEGARAWRSVASGTGC